MKCSFCGYKEDKVVDSRATAEDSAVRRRRECLKCAKRFTTYEYIEDNRYSEQVTASNYGGSVFTRLLLTRKIYAHAEFADINYEYRVSEQATDRYWVPFLYLGGGLIQPIGKSASAYLEVLVDVLQDDKSPYQDWTPLISAGVGVGF